jgi:hypothetical protein
VPLVGEFHKFMVLFMGSRHVSLEIFPFDVALFTEIEIKTILTPMVNINPDSPKKLTCRYY